MQQLRNSALTFLKNWTSLVQRFDLWVVFFSIILAVVALIYTKNNLGMNTDTKDMLSAELRWRQLDLEYEKNFPQYTDNILVVVEAITPDQALDAANLLYRKLLNEKELFKSVYYPNELSIFKESALLFLDINELQDLADNLATIQPFLGRLTQDQTLRGLFTMLEDAIDAREDGDDIDIELLLTQINDAIDATRQKQPYRVSWHKLMSGEDDNADTLYREFILLQPNLDYSNLLPATLHMERLRQLSHELDLSDGIGANIRLSGSAALSHEDLLSVTRGTEIAMVLAFTMVSIIMLVGLGSIRLVIVTLITLVFGLILTAAFATLTVGSLNLISVAFAVLYIGLGVDFAIHYCLRYRELRFEGQDNITAINDSSLNVGSSLFLCASTTAIGFFAFMPTDYDGVAELGWISGGGMFISLIVTLTLLPALLNLLPLSNNLKPVTKNLAKRFAWLYVLPFTHSRQIKLISLAAVIILLGFITQVRFDYNTLNLQDQSNESVQVFQELLADADTSPWTGIILGNGKADALAIVKKLQQLPLVEKILWLSDFIPEDQDEKLAIIEEMDLLLGDLTSSPQNSNLNDQERLEILNRFSVKLQNSSLTISDPLLLTLQQNLSNFVAASRNENSDALAKQMSRFERSLLDSLPGRLETLTASLNADYISEDSIPLELSQRWYNKEGDRYLIEIYPGENIQDNDAMRRFVDQLQAADPRVVGSPVINIEASDAVISAFQQAFSYALLVITLLLLILLVHKRDSVYIIASLLTAAIFTGGLSVLMDIPLNFANVIALPLILGIGVDSGIHILHRFRTALPADNSLLNTSSARAVVVSAMTTMGSIGNLAFSPQLGTASLGKLLTIGVAMTLVCMLFILPSLLASQLPAEK
ncbi:MAG: hopanoid biosynthesis associated RND transporter like protein HpnN [Gammaproteobacteria bacterium]|jgi:hopanoid biosynthesis associated RND transporter like protein HpnN